MGVEANTKQRWYKYSKRQLYEKVESHQRSVIRYVGIVSGLKKKLKDAEAESLRVKGALMRLDTYCAQSPELKLHQVSEYVRGFLDEGFGDGGEFETTGNREWWDICKVWDKNCKRLKEQRQ